MNRRLSCCLAALAIAACGDPSPPPSDVRAAQRVEIASPAGPASAEPALATGPDGSVYLSWLERQGKGLHALRFARLAPGAEQWTAPQTVVERDDLFVNWADFPSLLPTRSGRLFAHWLQKSGEGPYAYDVRIAQSSDAGASWSGSRVLHDDGVAAEHGFVSLWETADGQVQAAWLDARAGGESSADARTQLGFTSISPEGVPGPTELIDTRTCDCCQTDAAIADAGPVVAYRDRSEEEIRDIRVLRRVNGVWSDPVSVHADGWKIDGCPVNGPAIAARGERVVVAWFTGAPPAERVNVAFSEDGGVHFSPPLPVDEGNPLGRVDVVLDATGNALVSWLARGEGDTARVLLRRIRPDGERSSPLEVARSSAARASGFPRMVAVDDAVLLAWTDAAAPSRVRTARARLSP